MSIRTARASRHTITANLGLLSILMLMLMAVGCEGEQELSSNAEPPETLRDAIEDRSVKLIYVPAYTHALDQGGRLALTTTLMIHNVSPSKITIHSVRYYDDAGILVETKLSEPRELSALETLEFHHEPNDSMGGAGANFLVGWTGAPGIAPLVEALMVGHRGAGRLTFSSRGVEVGSERPRP